MTGFRQRSICSNNGLCAIKSSSTTVTEIWFSKIQFAYKGPGNEHDGMVITFVIS